MLWARQRNLGVLGLGGSGIIRLWLVVGLHTTGQEIPKNLETSDGKRRHRDS